MGSETGGRKCDARSRFWARKRSVAAGADRAAYARWGRHGKSLPAARAELLWTRVAGRDGARFGRSGIGEMASERNNEEACKKRRTPNTERPTSNENAGAQSRGVRERSAPAAAGFGEAGHNRRLDHARKSDLGSARLRQCAHQRAR